MLTSSHLHLLNSFSISTETEGSEMTLQLLSLYKHVFKSLNMQKQIFTVTELSKKESHDEYETLQWFSLEYFRVINCGLKKKKYIEEINCNFKHKIHYTRTFQPWQRDHSHGMEVGWRTTVGLSEVQFQPRDLFWKWGHFKINNTFKTTFWFFRSLEWLHKHNIFVQIRIPL